jgi:hypothetical protein
MMLNKTYHCITRALLTKAHLKEKQRENMAILATMAEAEIANLDTSWQLLQGARQTLPGHSEINTTDDALNSRMARQTTYEILGSYTQVERLLDGAAEKLREVQGDLNWFSLVEGAEIQLHQAGWSKYKAMREESGGGRYEMEISEALVTIQLVVDGLWQSALSGE